MLPFLLLLVDHLIVVLFYFFPTVLQEMLQTPEDLISTFRRNYYLVDTILQSDCLVYGNKSESDMLVPSAPFTVQIATYWLWSVIQVTRKKNIPWFASVFVHSTAPCQCLLRVSFFWGHTSTLQSFKSSSFIWKITLLQSAAVEY